MPSATNLHGNAATGDTDRATIGPPSRLPSQAWIDAGKEVREHEAPDGVLVGFTTDRGRAGQGGGRVVGDRLDIGGLGQVHVGVTRELPARRVRTGVARVGEDRVAGMDSETDVRTRVGQPDGLDREWAHLDRGAGVEGQEPK